MKLSNAEQILITGGNGFLGSVIVQELLSRGLTDEQIIRPGSKDYDLTQQIYVERLFDRYHPDVVIHAAAAVGGIGKNKKMPGTLYYQNMMMNTMVMEYSRRAGVKKYIAVGSGCVYPEHAPLPLKEADIWNGYPEKYTAPYGVSKKVQITQSQAYLEEFGFDAVVCLPSNLYGPNDHFHAEFGHVVPMLVRRFVEAASKGDQNLLCWGDGTPTRDFIYVDDAARAIVSLIENSNAGDVVNIGSGIETTIDQLVKLIAELSGYTGEISWDTTKPNGQQRRCCDTSKLNSLGIMPKIALKDGLKTTVDWFVNNYDNFRE